jgi:tripartite-type tricarboxylate transporter receptor subunit TctC
MRLIHALAALAAQASLALFSTAALAAWPEKPVRFIIPFPPGGAADLMARSLSTKLAEGLGQSVVVDYKPGAGGIIASEAGANAAADGYTLLFGTVGTHAINLSLYKKLPYDPVKQFTPVSITHSIPRVLVIHPSIPAKNVAELITYGKANPGKLNFSSAGSGSTSHLAGELFKAMSGVDMTHVAYKGSAPAMADLLAGRIAMTFDSVTVYAGHIKSGKVRALGVTSLKPIGVLADVPPIANTLAGFDVSNWAGVFVPAGTPRDIVDRLNAETRKAMADPESRKQLIANGIEPLSSSAEEFAAILRADIPKWAKVIKASGASAD